MPSKFKTHRGRRRPHGLPASEIGKEAEDRLFALIERNSLRLPRAVLEVKRASKRMDHACYVDMIVHMRDGTRLYFDIKSSERAAQSPHKFQKAIVFVLGTDNDEAIIERFVATVLDEYGKALTNNIERMVRDHHERFRLSATLLLRRLATRYVPRLEAAE